MGSRWFLVLLAAFLMLPIFFLLVQWQFFDALIWQHLWDYQLAQLVTNTVLLLLGTGIASVFLGTWAAYFVTFYRFPGRLFFEWALILPLVMPSYVFAFVTLGFFDFQGPIDQLLGIFFDDYVLWDVRSAWGVIMVLTLTLYPYVYLLVRSAFLRMKKSMIDSGRLMGLSPLPLFFKIILPVALPSIGAGLVLVLMEVVSDFGVVAVFNYNTLTTAIYQLWFGMFSLSSAAQLSSVLLFFVILLFAFSKLLHNRSVTFQTDLSHRDVYFEMTTLRGYLVSGICLLLVCVAFFFPLMQLVIWALGSVELVALLKYMQSLGKTLYLSSMSAILIVLLAFLMAHTRRYYQKRYIHVITQSLMLGYALPGTVLAVGIMVMWVNVDSVLSTIFGTLFGQTSDVFFSQSLLGLLMAYAIRMNAPAFYNVHSGMKQVSVSVEHQAYSLGARKGYVMRRVFYPIMRPSVFAALLIVFVDVARELPATLLLHPFGWETLAVHVFNFTAEAQWQAASLPALLLVMLGFLSVMYLIGRSRLGQG